MGNDQLTACDKFNLNLSWPCVDCLDDLPEPDVLVAEIVEDLEAALGQFRGVMAALGDAAASIPSGEELPRHG